VTDRAIDRVLQDKLHTAVIGDILDQLGYLTQFLPADVRSIRPDMKVVGRAMPVQLAASTKVRGQGFTNLMAALDAVREGEVYLASGGNLECAAWGELMTAAARSRGARGAVVNAYHRDTDRVLEQDWPVFSRGAYAQDAAVRSVVVDYRVRIDVDGVDVTPGDLVVGDRDGVLIVPQGVEDDVLRLAVEKMHAESRVRTAIDGGASATDAFKEFGVF
jgi:Demethylmenaquinone methyltransferase